MDNYLLLACLMFIVVLIVMGSSLWIWISIGVVGLLGFAFAGNIKLIGFVVYNTSSSFVLTAIPLFIFMGEILLRCEISEMLYRGISKLLSWLPGGLLHANIGSCALFASISGSSVATAAALGTVAIPALQKRGYDSKLSLGSLAAGGTLGILIPPSITMIVYGMLASVSVGRLFAGGVIPGIVLALMFMIYIWIRAKINPKLAPVETSFSVKEALSSFKDLWPFLILAIIILGGIFGGMFTPTEAAAVGASASIIISLIIRKFSWRILYESAKGALLTTCTVMIIVAGAMIFATVISSMNVPQDASKMIAHANLPPLLILLVIYVFYFILGCFLDATSMFVLTMGTVVPLIETIGYDLIWFGVVMVVLVEVGLLTPPVGLNLFVIQSISKKTLAEVALGCVPFFIIMFVMIGVMTAFPEIILWLPNILFGN